MNRYQTALCFVVATMMAVSGVPGQEDRGIDMPMYYDPASGNLTIDVTDLGVAQLTYYRLWIGTDGFFTDQYTPFMNTGFKTSRSDKIGEGLFRDGIDAGVYSLGNIMPTGLNPDELVAFFAKHSRNPNSLHGGTYIDNKVGSFFGLSYHELIPVYGASPFPPINDSTPREPIDWATVASLTYYANDGSLVLDTAGEQGGGTIRGYSVFLNEALFRPEGFTPIENELTAEAHPDWLVEMAIDRDGIAAGSYSLGGILPSGLSESEFFATIDRAEFIGQPGVGTTAFDFSVVGQPMALAYAVPEPNFSLFPMMICFTIWTAFRRTGNPRIEFANKSR